MVSTNSSVVDRDGVKKVRVVVSGIRFNVTLGDAKKEQGGGGLTAEAVEALQEFDHSVRLFLEGKLTTDADLARVRELPGVFGISVGKSQTTDAGFAELARAKQLSEVQWFGACADAGPAALAKLPDLRMLHVWGGTLTAEGVRTISGFPKLTNLYLMGEPVTSKGFEAVLSMQRLEMLGLTAKLTDKELEQLSKLKALKRLAYFGTKEEGGHLGEPEIRVLAGLKQLRTLSVGMCRVRREFIEELRTANHLQSADLQQCRFVDVVGKPGTANIVRLLPVLKPVPVPAASPIAAETRREGKLDVSIEPMPVIPAGFEAEEKGSRKDETKVPAKEEGGSADALNGPLELKALASKLRDEGAPIVVVPDQHNTILDLREPGESVLTSRVPFAFTEDERAAIRVIEAAGGKVRVLSGVGRMAIETKAGGKLRPTVTDLRFSAMFRESSMTPDAYAAVLGMKRMVRLSMFGSSLSDRQLQRLSELDQLRTFQYLPHANGAAEGVESVDEETLRILAGLKQLRELTVNNCRVTRSVIEELRGATHLRELSLLCRIVKPYGAVTGEKLVRLLAPAVQPAASETSGGRPAAPKLSLSIRDSPKVRPGFRPLRSGAEPDTIEVDPDYDDTTIRRHQRR